LYTDDGAAYVTVSGNLAFGNQRDWGYPHLNYTTADAGDYNPTLVENNYWQQGDAYLTGYPNLTVRGNRIITDTNQAPPTIQANPVCHRVPEQELRRSPAPDQRHPLHLHPDGQHRQRNRTGLATLRRLHPDRCLCRPRGPRLVLGPH